MFLGSLELLVQLSSPVVPELTESFQDSVWSCKNLIGIFERV